MAVKQPRWFLLRPYDAGKTVKEFPCESSKVWKSYGFKDMMCSGHVDVGLDTALNREDIDRLEVSWACAFTYC